jgi:hypothetical protein
MYYTIISYILWSWKSTPTDRQGARVVQSVCLTTDWTNGVQSSAEAKDFTSTLCVQIRSEAYPASYPMGSGRSLTGSKARSGLDADHSSHLVPKLRLSRSYASPPPWRLHGIAGQLYFCYERQKLLFISIILFYGFNFIGQQTWENIQRNVSQTSPARVRKAALTVRSLMFKTPDLYMLFTATFLPSLQLLANSVNF